MGNEKFNKIYQYFHILAQLENNSLLSEILMDILEAQNQFK